VSDARWDFGDSRHGIVRCNTVTQGALPAPGTGIEATGTITNNYVNGLLGNGIVVGAGSTVIGTPQLITVKTAEPASVQTAPLI
jgi:hypothetical protein